MRTIICTTGTSISPRVNSAEAPAEGMDLRGRIQERLKGLRAKTKDDRAEFLTQACAESNSLQKLNLAAGDRVVLLHSDTDDGAVCAAEVRQLLKETLQKDVELKPICGLQIRDVHKFRREGIQNLFATLDNLCSPHVDDPAHEIILNTTGGFKSTVPYITLYGLLYRLPVVYIFENSNVLLTLPPAPIHFDYERLFQAADALTRLRQETCLGKEEFFQLIPGLAYHERPWYESLLEEERGMVTLSAFGLLLTEAAQKEQAEVRLSPAADQAYRESRGLVREQFTFILERIRNPQFRQSKQHSFQGTDLRVYKPGNTGQRAAYFMRGQKVYVCELFGEHEDYERTLNGKRQANYVASEFGIWSRPADQPAPPKTESENSQNLVQRCEELESALRETEESWKAAESLVAELRAELATLRQK